MHTSMIEYNKRFVQGEEVSTRVWETHLSIGIADCIYVVVWFRNHLIYYLQLKLS